jgi:hypothetical protein
MRNAGPGIGLSASEALPCRRKLIRFAETRGRLSSGQHVARKLLPVRSVAEFNRMDSAPRGENDEAMPCCEIKLMKMQLVQPESVRKGLVASVLLCLFTQASITGPVSAAITPIHITCTSFGGCGTSGGDAIRKADVAHYRAYLKCASKLGRNFRLVDPSACHVRIIYVPYKPGDPDLVNYIYLDNSKPVKTGHDSII